MRGALLARARAVLLMAGFAVGAVVLAVSFLAMLLLSGAFWAVGRVLLLVSDEPLALAAAVLLLAIAGVVL